MSRVREAFDIDLPLRVIFENPTVEGLANVIERKRPEGNTIEMPPIERAEGASELPLSFGQEQLWFLDQIEPGGSTYNIPVGLRLQGRTNTSALEQSLKEIIRRHQSLRTVFPTLDGEPILRIVPHPGNVVRMTDVTRLGAESDEQARLVQEERRRSFDLERGPLVRAALFFTAEEEQVLVLTVHHIVSDGWSMGVLFKELGSLYDAYRLGEPSALKELDIQYTDYARWQRNWLRGEVLESELGYWKRQLEGAPVELALVTDRQGPPFETARGGFHSIGLSRPLSDRLSEFVRCERVTAYTVLLAGFKALLYGYTGHTDIIVGAPLANRTQVKTEALVGFFVNTLPLRTRVSPDSTFRELLGQVRDITLAAQAHQLLPLQRLVDLLAPNRNPLKKPVFEVVFDYHHQLFTGPVLSGVRISPVTTKADTAKFDLTLNMFEVNGAFSAVLEYRTDLFGLATIERMLEDYQSLLEIVVCDPERILSDVLRSMNIEPNQRFSATRLAHEKDIDSDNTDGDYDRRRTELALRRASLSSSQRAWLDERLNKK
jgi:hypothetical protein